LVLSPALLQSQTPSDVAQTPTPEDVGSDGSSTTVDDNITTTARDLLVSTTATLDVGHTHNCVVTASAGTFFGGGDPGTGGRYIFDLTRNGVSAPASARTVDFVDTIGVNDPNNKPVATNLTFLGLSGTHTFSFYARKSTSGSATLTVTESAISVVCQLSGAI
jgi:hypothetical protein